MRTPALLVATCVLVLSACGGSVFELGAADDRIEEIAQIWLEEVQLNRTEPSVWRPRLNAACDRGVWDPLVRSELANQFMAADLITAGGARFVDQSDLDIAARALWLMTAEACPGQFPPGALEQGPPAVQP